MDYRDTLNLPQTGFKMKANLAQKEPMVLKQWDKADLYKKIQEKSAEKPLYVLHDGPPYANGNIHLGTAFNKILKDIILRSKRMAGFNAPYIPGWDCHGLPIEHNVDKELGEKKRTIPTLSKRAACRKYANKWIKIQKEQFKRLGVLGDWDNPYLTINYGYEATIAREFNKFLLSGSVVKNRKPVYWCSTCTTALAEAEVEYHDHSSPSIYVKFRTDGDFSDIDPALAGDDVSFIIWTTTPWTLPANLAVALHPEFTYAAVKTGGETWIIAQDLVEKVMAETGRTDYEVAATFGAKKFEKRKCLHPFMQRQSLLVLADYVTADAGTGCVHTAPGHGADDYQTGLRYGLDILSPVDGEGMYTAEAGKYAGEKVPEVNKKINRDMDESGALVSESAINHSYPHCWRCKKPVMYRATPQWFISMQNNGLREKALAEIKNVTWTPGWGMQRIYSMVESRPDWCLSRQRSWGVPLTVVSCKDCGEVVRDQALVDRIDELFNKEGADAWYSHGVEDFLPENLSCSSCGGTNFVQEQDILDVWFDSGVSHAAVCEVREELDSPADLYLEGSDQHRGWFQSSLLASTGTRERAPFNGVLTHGYVVDGQGKKMSKSVGNVVVPSEVIEKYGAEILRLWVASEDYRDDIKVSDEILKQVSDSYRKIRNTIRYFLGNLHDFDPQKHRVETSRMPELDLWALAKFEQLRHKVSDAYGKYEFHAIYQALNYFCGTTMSSFYLDILKDRLYTSGTDSEPRRAAQTVLFDILDGLLLLMSPILCFTSAEAFDSLYGRKDQDSLEESIFFRDFPSPKDIDCDDAMMAKWEKLIKVRSEITKALEIARKEKVIGHSLEARVLLRAEGELERFVKQEWRTVKEISIISEMEELGEQQSQDGIRYESVELEGFVIQVKGASGEKCSRCWTRSETVGRIDAHPEICDRCGSVIAEMGL
ncbi:isoleucine--tRNA ligase [Desulforhopalus singaporensis]|uniref:Isoleucine--tRNA ligase n=1 Tax=Desulforhopalus singaporensis TaxID=91360 RepID=A0A1H0QLV0_9BACT|nr:isoleucine--tRNA ligase [Desulforhopalus singaporensis]SDP18304.1 Isoleucyl-tRNA synthetase [Desulforhopalus singaporensis]